MSSTPKIRAKSAEIEDVQSRKDTRRIAINKVGIKDIRHHFKGTHMSRFVEILNQHEREISVESFKEMLTEMTERLEAVSGHIEMSFPYFVNKKAPVSKVASLMDYDVSLIGEINDGKVITHIKVVYR